VVEEARLLASVAVEVVGAAGDRPESVDNNVDMYIDNDSAFSPVHIDGHV
tara:strand:+ start:4171 stop:4320 length:150 start_codon:yes stop_codon:yes gene_type:complete